MSSNIKRFQANMPNAAPSQNTKRQLGEKLTRNVSIAVLVLLTVTAVRQSATEQGGSFMQALQTAVESQWDQNVGRLTYVNVTLSEALQVFSPENASPALVSPVRAKAVQAWSGSSPYLLYENAGQVFAAAAGEVGQILHDDQDEFIVRLLHDNGLNTIYYGLKTCNVQEGAPVSADTLLGTAGDSLAFEVQKNGKSLDCSATLTDRNKS